MGGLKALMGDKVQIASGFDYIADLFELRMKIAESDLVITGEGCFDAQTKQGKVVSGV